MQGRGGLLERMAESGVDVISVDQSTDMADARKRIPSHLGIQGNLDPAYLWGSQEWIEQKVVDTVKKAQGGPHILNLGHGVMVRVLSYIYVSGHWLTLRCNILRLAPQRTTLHTFSTLLVT